MQATRDLTKRKTLTTASSLASTHDYRVKTRSGILWHAATVCSRPQNGAATLNSRLPVAECGGGFTIFHTDRVARAV